MLKWLRFRWYLHFCSSRKKYRPNYWDTEALSKLGGARAVEPLIGLLRVESVGMVAAQALGELMDVRAVEPLIQVLKQGNREVRQAAADALAKLGDARAVEPLIGELRYLQHIAVGALVKLGPGASVVEPVIRELGISRDAVVRCHAVLALGELGDARAVVPLILAVGDEKANVRFHAVQALQKLGHSKWVQWVTGDSSDRDRLLASNDPDAIAPGVRLALLDGGFVLNMELLEQRGGVVIDLLIDALKDREYSVRSNAAKVLGKLGDARAILPLIDALTDREDPHERHDRWLASYNLDEYVEDMASGVRAEAAEALGRIGDKRAVAPLIKVLEDETPWVRAEAAKALAKLRDARSIGPLAGMLAKDCYNDARRSAVQALKKLGDERAAEAIILALESKYEEDLVVSEYAEECLVEMGGVSVEPLVQALGHQNQGVRWRIVRALERLRDSRTVEPLVRALTDWESNVRKAAAEALRELDDARAVEPLIRALTDSDENVREACRRGAGWRQGAGRTGRCPRC